MKKLLLFAIYLFLSLHTITAQQTWDREVSDYFIQNKISFLKRFHYYTYLYVAQNDADVCDERVLNSIAVELAQHLFPDFERATPPDLIAQRQAQEILVPYMIRLNDEALNTHTFPSTCWFETYPHNVELIAHWIPWSLPLPTIPPSIAFNNHQGWADQFAELRVVQDHLSDDEIAAVHQWARGKGCCWYQLANAFMEKEEVPFKKVLLVRATLMKALYDGMIAEYEMKYRYCVPRPGHMDPTFKPMLFLDSPSYPSGHAVQSAIAGTILSFFFPEFSTYWQEQAHESAQTRIWAGVHFPIDVEQGEVLGRKVAKQILLPLQGPS